MVQTTLDMLPAARRIYGGTGLYRKPEGLKMAMHIQVAVSDALQELKFEARPPELTGGPQKLKPTEEVAKFIQSLVEDGKTVVVASNGTVRFE
jgi:hypothetical protein